MNRTRLLFLCLITLAFSMQMLNGEVRAEGADIFVSPVGTVTSTCQQDDPCHYLTGIALAEHGDSVYFKFGSYESDIYNPMITLNKGVRLIGSWDGSPSGPVTVNPAIRSTINGEDTKSLVAINDTVATNTIVISGFTFRGGNHLVSGGAINIKDGRVLIEDNVFVDNKAEVTGYGGAINIQSQKPVTIRKNVFENNRAKYGGGAIAISAGEIPTERILIEENRFMGGAAMYGTAIHVSNGFIEFNRNLLIDVKGTKSAISLSTYNPIPPSLITNNIIIRSKLALEFGGESTQKHQVWNNTFVNCEDKAINTGFSAEVDVTNNIITGTPVSISGQIGFITGSNNLFFNNSDDNDPTYKLTNPITFQDPLFVDPDHDDYHLQSDSPAIDAGAPVNLLVDFDGDIRPNGVYYDIGADEFLDKIDIFLPLILK